ncbi:hypothetical protein FJT64_017604 [Amphibalanus amphitrite]|uniref:G-protein coupled receptors family 1 profile domain-containing protein n=1 Tax=Amphibalanus amphitrite TaxID=1232801 RepID=A0A6A4VVT5_AMPAM|nr:hypothetical protein FJT64_000775 [Amphibalanus amphitrite]KAF0311573.1 hypothetical protein FJT64_017604 [Amphibalanus amphitrite]
MVYIWVKTVVGAVLSINFSFPLITVLSNRHLWDEPMALIAGSMSLNCTVFGLFVMLIGLYDVAGLQSESLCHFMQYGGSGAGIAFKAAQSCAALDQFVAVAYPLQHYAIMTQARPWLFTSIWIVFAANVLFGLVSFLTDMETFFEHVVSRGGNSTYSGCRWETGMTHAFTILAEMEMVTFSLITAGMLLYAGTVGHRTYKKLMKEDQQRRQHGHDESNGERKTFLDNYRAFKSIVTVLSLTVSLDIVAPLVRISSRWRPRPMLNGILHQLRLLGFIFEGWAYGLLNAKLRAAYRKMLCCKSRRVDDLDASRSVAQHAAKNEEQPPVASADPNLELHSIASNELRRF